LSDSWVPKSSVLKGLPSLRSKSAPPATATENAIPVATADISVLKGSESLGGSPLVVPSLLARSVDAIPPLEGEPTVEQVALPYPFTATREPVSRVTFASQVEESSKAHPVFSSTPPAVTPIIRGASSGPPLEAVLLDRKRRQNAANTSASPASLSRSPSGKSVRDGAPTWVVHAPVPLRTKSKFKSSPLGSGEWAGMVTAEQVKEASNAGGEHSSKARDREGLSGNYAEASASTEGKLHGSSSQ